MKVSGNRCNVRMVIPIAIMKHMTIHPFAFEERKGAIFLFFLLLNPASVFVVELSEDKDKKSRKTTVASPTLKANIVSH